MTMIEKLARAMWVAERGERTPAVFPGGRSAKVLWSEAELTEENYGLLVTESDRDKYRRKARAALDALEEPTPEMLEAAFDALVPAGDATACWRAMIKSRTRSAELNSMARKSKLTQAFTGDRIIRARLAPKRRGGLFCIGARP